MRRRLAIYLLSIVIAVPAAAQDERPQALTRVLDCRTLADAGERLECFDREVAAMEQAEASKDLVVVDRKQLRDTRRSLFGLTLPSLAIFGDRDDDEEESVIETTIRTASVDPYGKFVVLLEDGAVWRQIDDRVLAIRPRAGQAITIRKAAMGSYLANVNAQGAVRVRRDR